ncbi:MULTISPECIES: hypothetical protein [Corallococcus]|uniref:hypothetical protein n=1 Tax=Corallococcus TaxID=83461 RepID=UPI0013157B12|nr:MULTISPECIES: hypothetical protein [Corallococcus]MCY1034456.1 hypothetical protein [Corallococcus sp. BB11-1]
MNNQTMSAPAAFPVQVKSGVKAGAFTFPTGPIITNPGPIITGPIIVRPPIIIAAPA